MEIERMNPNERDTNTANSANSPESKTIAAVITYANGLLATAESNQKAAESNQKAIQKLLDTLNQTMERQQAGENALSAKWKTQLEAQARAFDLQTKTITNAVQSASHSAYGGAKDGVYKAIADAKEEALDVFGQALKPDLQELNQVMLDIQEAKNDFKNAALYLTWKAVGLYALVAVLPLLALLGWDWHLVQKIEGERATINSLDEKGGRAKLTHCGDDNRLCVKIDNKAGSFNVPGEKGEYRIIDGY